LSRTTRPGLTALSTWSVGLAVGDGSVFSYSPATWKGNAALPAGETAVAIVAKQDGSGYWIVTDGGYRFDNGVLVSAQPQALPPGQVWVDAAANDYDETTHNPASGYRVVTDGGSMYDYRVLSQGNVPVATGQLSLARQDIVPLWWRWSGRLDIVPLSQVGFRHDIVPVSGVLGRGRSRCGG